jgi:hypothetical protein
MDQSCLNCFGGAYVCPAGCKAETNGGTTTTTRYYAIGGQTVATYDGTNLRYTLRVRCLLTDHLGSVVAVTDASGKTFAILASPLDTLPSLLR